MPSSNVGWSSNSSPAPPVRSRAASSASTSARCFAAFSSRRRSFYASPAIESRSSSVENSSVDVPSESAAVPSSPESPSSASVSSGWVFFERLLDALF